MKPDAPATGRNREPILAVLERWLQAPCRVLEVGSGTGQHAVYFGERLPGVTWQCSDRAANLAGIGEWVTEAALPNVPPALELDVRRFPALDRYDVVFTANTLHIMAWEVVEAFFAAVRGVLTDAGQLIVYGPFKRDGRYTTPSNEAFDAQLTAQAPHQGLRDVADVDRLAVQAGLTFSRAEVMPANNELLLWRVKG
ncbi:MAG: DUF938 domain-containing protein [Pseudomonadota bacterium]